MDALREAGRNGAVHPSADELAHRLQLVLGAVAEIDRTLHPPPFINPAIFREVPHIDVSALHRRAGRRTRWVEHAPRPGLRWTVLHDPEWGPSRRQRGFGDLGRPSGAAEASTSGNQRGSTNSPCQCELCTP